MATYGWEVWSPGVATPAPLPDWLEPLPWWQSWRAISCGSFLVGRWTGANGDLLCVKACETNKEAERWLSPPGYTILDACLRSVAVLAANGLVDGLQMAEIRRIERAHRKSRQTPATTKDASVALDSRERSPRVRGTPSKSRGSSTPCPARPQRGGRGSDRTPIR